MLTDTIDKDMQVAAQNFGASLIEEVSKLGLESGLEKSGSLKALDKRIKNI